MSEMVERVAIAIAMALESQMPERARQRWEDYSMPARAAALVRARKAIEAMREPTDAVIEAGRWPAEDDGPLACWQAMIDAALTPTGMDGEK